LRFFHLRLSAFASERTVHKIFRIRAYLWLAFGERLCYHSPNQ